MKIFKRIILFLGILFLSLLILLVATFAIIKHLKIKDIVEKEIEHTLGINVSINKIDFSPLLAHVGIKGITINNPSGFEEPEFAYLNYIHFVVDPLEILASKKPIIYLFALDIKRLHIIKNKDGRVNIKEIIPIKEDSASEKTPFSFGVLVFSIEEVKYTDYAGLVRKDFVYPVNIKNATFVGLKDENDLVRLVVYKAIENTDIGKMINLKVVPVVTQLKDTMDAAWGTAKSGAKSAWAIATLPFKLVLGK